MTYAFNSEDANKNLFYFAFYKLKSEERCIPAINT